MSQINDSPDSAFATVAVTIPVGPLGMLTYGIPASLRASAVPGMRVLVPVGRRKTTGVIINTSLSADLEDTKKIKDVLEIFAEDPVLPPDLLRLWRWAADYYLADPSDILSALLPGGLRRESAAIITVRKGHTADTESLSPHLTATEQALWTVLKEKRRVTMGMLRRSFPSSSLGKSLQTLENLQMVERSDHLPRRRASALTTPSLVVHHDQDEESLRGAAGDEAISVSGRDCFAALAMTVPQENAPPFTLSSSQALAFQQITQALLNPLFRVFLLHGVTGSGKTEVYLRAAQAVADTGKSVLILVPEIALTHQLVAQVRGRFGTSVAVLHSAITERERRLGWQRVARGEATVVVGVRSAVFAPLPHLGLIVVDEEHDTSYKQDEGTLYNARDLAVVRAQMAACPVLLGSATPSLETYTHGRNHRYTAIDLPERIDARPLPAVEVVDLRQALRVGEVEKGLSSTLRQALLDNYQAGKQSLLFLNRRGYATYLQCRSCGEVVSCPHCSVTLTLHLKRKVLLCHYCGFQRPAPEACPHCNDPALAGGGIGTEQVEATLKRLMPNVRVARLDRDSVSRRGALEQLLTAWRRHEIDILVGTQMVTKGHDVPAVTLVGVLLADVSLNLPDFRAAERTFQLLTQVTGRAGRGPDPGRVIIQTYIPSHYSIRCAARHDFTGFARQELRYRKRLGYPPFTRMVNIRFAGKDGAAVRACAERVAHLLQPETQPSETKLRILGPAPAPLERLQGRERWQLLLIGEDRQALHALARKVQAEARSRTQGVRIVVDVDPYNML